MRLRLRLTLRSLLCPIASMVCDFRANLRRISWAKARAGSKTFPRPPECRRLQARVALSRSPVRAGQTGLPEPARRLRAFYSTFF
jgi:hypothetical protein